MLPVSDGEGTTEVGCQYEEPTQASFTSSNVNESSMWPAGPQVNRSSLHEPSVSNEQAIALLTPLVEVPISAESSQLPIVETAAHTSNDSSFLIKNERTDRNEHSNHVTTSTKNISRDNQQQATSMSVDENGYQPMLDLDRTDNSRNVSQLRAGIVNAVTSSSSTGQAAASTNTRALATTKAKQKVHERVPCTYPGCTKTLSVVGMLRHTRTHTGEKPFSCKWPSCDKKFSRGDLRNKHFLQHSVGKTFQCNRCMRTFSKKATRDTHIARCRSSWFTTFHFFSTHFIFCFCLISFRNFPFEIKFI